jgi:hypothetical protein
VNNVTINDADEPLDPQGNNSSSAGTKIVPCMDVTGDKAVRVVDINALVERYGLGVGDPGYDLLYDLDGNGRILVSATADLFFVKSLDKEARSVIYQRRWCS